MAAPHLDIKTILTTNSGQVWAPVGGTTLRPDPPTIAPSVITTTTVTVTISVGVALTSRIPYLNGNALSSISGAATSYQFTGLVASTPYSLSFVDERSGRFSSVSMSLQITTDTPPVVPPSPPTISFVSKDASSITINSTGSAGATSYIPVRSGTSLAEITQFPYTFTGLSGGTLYTLTVKAKNSAGTSAVSNTISQTTNSTVLLLPAAPVSFLAIGTTDFTNPADEIYRRACCTYLCLTLHPGITASQYSNHIAAIRAINPNVKILAYLNFSEVQTTSGSGVWGPFWTLINNANWWARLGSGTPGLAGLTGTITQIENAAINLASPRKVGGLTSGEAFVEQYVASCGGLLSQVDGFLLDNYNIRWTSSFDYNEDGVSEDRSSAAMMNAMITAHQVILNKLKQHYPAAELFGNPRVAQDYVQDGIDWRAAFRAMRLDGFQNQNAGPGPYYSEEGIWPFKGRPTTYGAMHTYPGGLAVPVGTTPVRGDLYNNGFGGYQSSTIPTKPLAPKLNDMGQELTSYGYVTKTQKILMECAGYSEIEELVDGNRTSAADKQQHNRYCLGYWWVMTDVTPFIYGVDTTPASSGRCVILKYQDRVAYNPGNWIDPPGLVLGTINGQTLNYRRGDGIAVVYSRRKEDAGIASQPASIAFSTALLQVAGKTLTDWSGSPIGSTDSIGIRDAKIYKLT